MDRSSPQHFLKPVFPQWPPSEAQAWPHVIESERSHAMGRVEASAYVSNGIALASLRSRICSDAVHGDVFYPPASTSQPAVASLSPQEALTPGQQRVWLEIDKIFERRHAEARLRKPEKPKVAKTPALTSTATSFKPDEKSSRQPVREQLSPRQEVDKASKLGEKAAAHLSAETTQTAEEVETRPTQTLVNTSMEDESTAPKAAPKSARRLRQQKRIVQSKFYTQIDPKRATQPQVDDESSWGALSGLFGATDSSPQDESADGGWSLARNVGGLLWGRSDDTGVDHDKKEGEGSEETPSQGVASSTLTAAKQVGASVASKVTNTGSAAKQAGTAMATSVVNSGSAAKQAGAAMATNVANTTGRLIRKPFGGKDKDRDDGISGQEGESTEATDLPPVEEEEDKHDSVATSTDKP